MGATLLFRDGGAEALRGGMCSATAGHPAPWAQQGQMCTGEQERAQQVSLEGTVPLQGAAGLGGLAAGPSHPSLC